MIQILHEKKDILTPDDRVNLIFCLYAQATSEGQDRLYQVDSVQDVDSVLGR